MIAVKTQNAIAWRVRRQDSHSIAVASVLMSYTTSPLVPPCPTRATNISANVASRD